MYLLQPKGICFSMSTETTHVRLRWEKTEEGNPYLSDGRHTYFQCLWTRRVRWACTVTPDDGWGIRAHGAADTLLLAIEDAYEMNQLRKRCYEKPEKQELPSIDIRTEKLKSPTEL